MGAPPHASDGPVRAPFTGAQAAIGLSSRLLFQIAVGVILAATLVFMVIKPAVERGGAGELLVIAAVFAAILLAERWLRTR